MRKFLFVIILVVKWIPSFSQNLNVYGITPLISQTTPISKKIDWGLFLGTTYNPQNLDFSGLEYPSSDIRLLFTNSISYKASKNISLTFGLHYQRNFPFDDRHINEFKPYQQVTFSQSISSFKISYRVRFSERFVQNTTSSNYPLTTMLQYLTSVQIPIKSDLT